MFDFFPSLSSCNADDRARFAMFLTRSIWGGGGSRASGHSLPRVPAWYGITPRSQFLNFHLPMGSLVSNVPEQSQIRPLPTARRTPPLPFMAPCTRRLNWNVQLRGLHLSARTVHLRKFTKAVSVKSGAERCGYQRNNNLDYQALVSPNH
jgi:hypothetical protein